MNNLTYFLLVLFGGWFGLHKFIQKKILMGILYLFTFGLFGIGWMIDIVIAIKNLVQSKATKPAITQIKSNTCSKILVVGESYKKNEISSILSGNRIYNLPDETFILKAEPRNKVYRFKYRTADAELVPEPSNPHDKDAIMVLVDGVHIGYIPKEQCLEIKKILPKVKSIKVDIYGGDYKYHSNNEVFKTENDFTIDLYITV